MPYEDPLNTEEEFHAKDRKSGRKERKLLSQKDRSQFKKTDQDKAPSLLPPQQGEKGRVLSILSEGVLVGWEQKEIRCTLKGSLKKNTTQKKNLLAVGDLVFFTLLGEKEGVITHIEKRHSVLSRADNLSRKKEQLLAVNVDYVVITTSVLLPPLKPSFIDRYLIAAQRGHITPLIAINKIDLLQSSADDPTLQAEKALYQEMFHAYPDVPLYPVSAATGEGLTALKKALKGKVFVFSGQSGTGKSSLINALFGTHLTTGNIVIKTHKGSHTTTTAQLFPVEEGGFCVDTPGVRSFEIWGLEKAEVAAYFPEIFQWSSQCKYPSCLHFQEPGCAVQKAMQEGRISPLRFASYCGLMESLSEKHQNR